MTAISQLGGLTGGMSRGLSSVRDQASSFAQALKSSAGGQAAASTAPAANAAAAQQQYALSLGDLQQTLSGLFASAGIDTSQPIAIAQSPEGTLSVAGSHPDMDKLEELLANHPELVAKFKAASANLRQASQAAGGQNLPDATTASFTFTLTNGQATGSLN
jgi:hypothetical protein